MIVSTLAAAALAAAQPAPTPPMPPMDHAKMAQGDRAPMSMDCCKDCCDKMSDRARPRR